MPAADDADCDIVCVVCERLCYSAHICRVCTLPCHIFCGGDLEEGTENGAELTCKLCMRQDTTTTERQSAKRSLEVQAEQMKKSSDKRFKEGEVGNNVRVPIPEVDRGRTDHRNLLGIIMDATNGFYKIGTRHGVLKSL